MTYTIERNKKGQFIKKELRKNVKPTFVALLINKDTQQETLFNGYKKQERATIEKCVNSKGHYEMFDLIKNRLITIKNGIITIKENQNYLAFIKG